MATLKYFESTLRSKELLKYTISFIGNHRLSANPINYTVCYEYLLGGNLGLNQVIDKAISDNSPLTDQMMGAWFEAYLSGSGQADVGQSQADLMGVISKLNDFVTVAEKDVNQFNQALRSSENELATSKNSLESVVADLLLNTRTMQVSMEMMKQQMQESKQEITYLKERLEKATEEALTDPLTSLTNRKGLAKAIDRVLLEEDIKIYPCLLMLDIDHFKKINDSFGHLLGDRVIKVVANTVGNQIKGKDTAARYGGEEFCVLLPETEPGDAVKVAENIRLAIEKTRINRSSDNQEICRVTISIGVARYNPEVNEPTMSMFERADNALYQSKNEGRNRVTFAE
ncbi:MAG: GGDEF domain-containing protein [Methylococcaceae bacterium]|nr:GGDEF domain-containing protein [Methylococcaceae bacterium]